MAKVTGPLMSMEASGAFGGALVFGKWKGRPTVRQLVIPSNPKSANQTVARNSVRITGAAQKGVTTSLQKKSGQTLTDKQLLTAKAPSGFAWNGFLTDEMIGAGGINMTASKAAYTALLPAEKTAWNTSAAARVPAFSAAAQTITGGAVGVAIAAGEVYFHQQYAMWKALIFTTAPGAVPPTYA